MAKKAFSPQKRPTADKILAASQASVKALEGLSPEDQRRVLSAVSILLGLPAVMVPRDREYTAMH